jgi:hypothetical protein
MSNPEEVDSFAAMFAGPPASRRQAREVRVQKERRTQLTEKQRGRRGERTAQINFRCSPEYKARLQAIQEHLGGVAIADIQEEALELLAKDKGFKG